MVSGKSFAFTGEMATMSRKHAQEEVLRRGGSIPSSVTRELDFLVVGNKNSPLINNGNGKKGKKLRKVEELNQRGEQFRLSLRTVY
jgi:NAD-dependent DNA ligase